MARIRSIKPELRTSLTAAEWPRDARYLWVLLWGYLDDYGRGVDDARLVKADCFPLDDDVTAEVVECWLQMFATSGSLCRYSSGDGTRHYFHCPEWSQHQRPSHPTDSRIPECPVHDHSSTHSGKSPETLARSGGEAPELLVPEQVIGDVVREVTTTPSPTAPSGVGKKPHRLKAGEILEPEAFARFWRIYPRKQSKGAAEKAWNAAIRANVDPKRILEGLEFYVLERRGQDPKYTKHPSTWLNGKCWDDQPDPTYSPPAIGAPSEAAAVQPLPYREVMARHERTVGDGFDFGDAFGMPA